MESAIQFFSHFTSELLLAGTSACVLIFAFFMAIWVVNKKKYKNLKHQIPAGVMKDYLDSIIQNSTALKSSITRGNEFELGKGVPSVMPLSNLGGEGTAVSGASSEDLSRKNAEIAALQAEVSQKSQTVSDLESQLEQLRTASGGGDIDVSVYEEKIAELERALEAASAGAGGDASEIQTQLDLITKERDELRDKLQEYEIIEDDLANLKRLQQENEQLKKSIGADAASEPVEVAAEETVEETITEEVEEPEAEEAPEEMEALADEPVAEETIEEPEVEESVAAGEEAPAEEAPAEETDDKSPEDLLSEFEKMLG